jgi:nucleoid-associated protein YgaU
MVAALPGGPPRIVIQPGNNLWRIARVIYGDGRRYTEIFDANKELIKNPNRIYPGQVFATPKVVPPETIDPAQRTPLQSDEAASAQ